MKVQYIEGADLPDLVITWLDSNDALIDFSSGYNFELKIGQPGKVALVTKTTGIGGFAIAPNVVIAWSTSGELNSLPANVYVAQLKASRIADGKSRLLTFEFVVGRAVL